MVNESENKDTNAVAGLLGSLPRVEAPNDFDFRVKARIAAGRPARAVWFPAAARVAVPLGLVLSVGGYFGYRSVYQPIANDATVVSSAKPETVPITATTDEIVKANVAAPETPGDVGSGKLTVKPPVVDDKMLTSVKTDIDPKIDPLADDRRTVGNSRGGSFDTAVKESRTVYPRGVNPNAKVPVKSRDFDRPGAILAKDVLTQFGADVVYSGSGWRVAVVKDNSAAQKAGLKSGDIVEAINDQPLKEKTSFKGQFSGKSMSLKRDGATLVIDLKKP